MANQPVETVSATGDKVKLILAICAVIAGVVGFYLLSDQSAVVRAGIFAGALLIAIAVASTAGPGRNFIGFARESVREARKVVWPTRKEAMQITAVVFGFVLVMAIFLWGTDKILEFLLYDLILGWKK